MVKINILIVCTALVLGACAYSVFSNVYPHLKRIRIAAFDNQSSEFDIGEKTMNALSTSFRDDGRLQPVTQSPDCLLEGSLLSYEEKIYSFDAANNVQDYQIRITFSILFTDLVRNETIFENKALTLTSFYAVSAESTSKNKTKEEAVDEILDNLFKNIMQNSLENW